MSCPLKHRSADRPVQEETVKPAKPANRTKQRALLGAGVGALVGIGGPFLWLFFSSAFYSGGGANIGLGLLVTAMPFYAPVVILLGALLGAATSPNVSADMQVRQKSIQERAEPQEIIYSCRNCQAMNAESAVKCDRCGAPLSK